MTAAQLLPSANETTARYGVSLLLALIFMGFAGNYFSFQLILNVDFLFGTIFALLALQFFGLRRGVLATAIIACCTYFLWNHPYAIVVMIAEVGVVGWQMGRYNLGMVLADALYWLFIGMPLVYLFYHIMMHTSPDNTCIIMTKQAMNGIANALAARLIFTGYCLRSRSFRSSYGEIICNLLAFFVLFPSLSILTMDSRNDFKETDRSIRTNLIQEKESLRVRLEVWLNNRRSAIVNLAEMAASRTPQEMRPYLEAAKKSDKNYEGIELLDRSATFTAVPLVDEQGASSIGENATDRPYLPLLKQSLTPMLSEVLLMGRVGIPTPNVFMLAPVVVGGEFGGSVIGILSLEQIREYLDINFRYKTTLYTLLDKNSNVIMSNRTDQKVMMPFERGQGTINPLDSGIKQWVPFVPSNVSLMERWKNSSYVAETDIGDLAEWKLIIEEPVAPFQKALNDKYTGKLFFLFLILIVSLVLAEMLSRRSIISLVKLGLSTKDLPIRLETGGKEISWPASGIIEINHLIENFKEMANSLKARFDYIQRINESLEVMVKERTAKLGESEAKYHSAYSLMRRLCDNVPDMIWAKDLEGRYLFTNEAVCRHLLIAADTNEPIGKSDVFFAERERIRHTDNPKWYTFGEIRRNTDAITLEAGKPQQFEEYGNVQGKFLFLDVRKAPFIDDNGKIIGTVGSARDATIAKDMERKLKESEKRLSDAAKTAKFGVYSYDFNNGQTYYSPEFLAIYGLPPDGFRVLNEELITKGLHPDDKPEFLAHMKAANDPCGSGLLNFEYRMILPNGQVRWLRLIGQTTFSGNQFDDHALQATGIVYDITEKKKATNALKQAYDEMEERVLERTADLEKTNATLSMMLDYARKAEIDIQERVVANIRTNSLFLLDSLKNEQLPKNALDLVELLETTTKSLVHPLAKRLESNLLRLSSREIQIASLIRLGKSSKEIMKLLNLSLQTVGSHRNNLRKKLGINNKKVNLRTYLNSENDE